VSVHATSAVWKWSQASGNALLVLLAIADWAEDDGSNAYPHIRTLAAKCRLSERTVERTITKLEALGELRVLRRGGGPVSIDKWHRPNRFDVVLSGGDDLTPPLATNRRKAGGKGGRNLASLVSPQGSVKDPSGSGRRSSGSALGGAGRTRAQRDLPAGQVDVGA